VAFSVSVDLKSSMVSITQTGQNLNLCVLKKCIISQDLKGIMSNSSSDVAQKSGKMSCKFPFKPTNAVNYTIRLQGKNNLPFLDFSYTSPRSKQISYNYLFLLGKLKNLILSKKLICSCRHKICKNLFFLQAP